MIDDPDKQIRELMREALDAVQINDLPAVIECANNMIDLMDDNIWGSWILQNVEELTPPIRICPIHDVDLRWGFRQPTEKELNTYPSLLRDIALPKLDFEPRRWACPVTVINTGQGRRRRMCESVFEVDHSSFRRAFIRYASDALIGE
jgi:hypothetical protein